MPAGPTCHPRLHFGRPPLGPPAPRGVRAVPVLAAAQRLFPPEGLRGPGQLHQQHLGLALPAAPPGSPRGCYCPVGRALAAPLRRAVGTGSGPPQFPRGLRSCSSILTVQTSRRQLLPCSKTPQLAPARSKAPRHDSVSPAPGTVAPPRTPASLRPPPVHTERSLFTLPLPTTAPAPPGRTRSSSRPLPDTPLPARRPAGGS